MMRVLHIVGKMDCGGAENFIMSTYRQLHCKGIQFDFVVHTKNKCFFDDEIAQLGGKIHRVTPMSQNIFKHLKELYAVIKKNNYKVIHRHTNSSIIALDLVMAKFAKATNIIVHSHSTNSELKRNIPFMLLIMNKVSTRKFACSVQAGEKLYGKNANFEVLTNGIDTDKYQFNAVTRSKIRDEYKLHKNFVFGHVGSFRDVKNQEFLIDLLSELKNTRKDIKLLLIGDGTLLQPLKNKVSDLELTDNVIFTGVKPNINELMMGMDLFLFPSKYEGLGIVLVEAQASGLNCIAANTVPGEANVTGNVDYLDISNGVSTWIEAISQITINSNRNKYSNIVKENGYDIIDTVVKLETIYKEKM